MQEGDGREKTRGSVSGTEIGKSAHAGWGGVSGCLSPARRLRLHGRWREWVGLGLGVALVGAGLGLGRSALAALPGEMVPRSEMALYVTRALRLGPQSVGPTYVDVGPSLEPAVRGAILAGADQGLWGAWVPGSRFEPSAPATVGEALDALLIGKGYGHVAADLPDGIVRLARAFGIWPAGAPSLGADLTPRELRYATAHLPSQPPARAVRLADETVKKVVFQYGSTTLGAGGASWVLVTPQDAAGYTVPVPYDSQASAGRFAATEATYFAPDAVPKRGEPIRLTARVGNVAGHLTLKVVRLGGLGFVPAMPTVASAGRTLMVTGAVLAESAPFASDNGRVLTLTVRGPKGILESQEVQDQAGVAPFEVRLPDLAGRSVTLDLSAQGLRPVTKTIRLLAGPVPGPVVTDPHAGKGPFRPGARLTWQIRPGSGWPREIALTRPLVTVTGPLEHLAVRSENGGRTWRISAVAGPYGGQATVQVAEPGANTRAVTRTVRVAAGRAVPLNCVRARAGEALRIRIGSGSGLGGKVHVSWTGPGGSGSSTESRPGTVSTLVRPVTVAGSYIVSAYAAGSGMATRTCRVLPGAVTHLAVHLTPTPFLRVGQTARVWAAWEDAYGNPVRPAGSLRVAVKGGIRIRTGAPKARARGAYIAAVTAVRAGAGEVLVTVSGSSPGAGSKGASSSFSLTVRRPVTVLSSQTSLFELPGMWLPYWIWQADRPETFFAEARANGIRVIYLEVATSANGFYGAPALLRFVAQAHSRGLAVVPWVYADLAQPAQDVANARAVLGYVAPDGTRPDGFASDLEANAELPAWAVAPFLARLRGAVGRHGSLLVVTYPPGSLAPPYSLVARYASAIGPMDYWHGNPVDMGYLTAYTAVQSAVTQIRHTANGTAVIPVLEAFDMFTPSGMGAYSPTPAELAGAIAAARSAGAAGISFYQWGTVTPPEWNVIHRMHA